MTDRIKRLCINDFRGATQPLDLEFDENKSVVLIFGENGTGKSTIVDAIESVGSGSTAFLDDWKLGKGKRKESYIPTIGKKITDVKIDLEFGEKTYSAKLSAKGLLLCDTPNRPITKILRRKSLQAFIDADPAQRYKEVANFLDIPQIEISENALRQAFKDSKKQYEAASAANSQTLESLQSLWEAEGSPGLEKKQNAECWARSEVATPIEELQKKLVFLQTNVKQLEALQHQNKRYEESNSQLIHAQTALTEAEEKIAILESGQTSNNAQLVTLLQDAKKYLSKTPDEICPVCEETKIEPTRLVERLDQRIGDMNEIKQANVEVSQARQKVQTSSENLAEAEKFLLEVADVVQQNFVPDCIQSDLIKELRSNDPQYALAVAIKLCIEVLSRFDEIQNQVDETQKKVNNLTSIKQQVQTLDDKSSEAKLAESLHRKLGKAVGIFEAKRKNYVENILLDIAKEVDALYQQIHPNKNIGQIKLKLDESQKGSLLYGVAFANNKDVHPQPYYSESHLDTLGLCIFLALAKRGDQPRTVVVLDDVLGSVDQQHLNLTLAMLLEQSNCFAQLIITTHYRPLRDRFRFARNPTSSVQLLELKPWNFEQGIRTGKTFAYAKELKQQLQGDGFRRDVIASQAGQLYEGLLEFISRTYRCKVPHLIEPRFTFYELANAPNKNLKQQLKTVKTKDDGGEQIIPLLPIYEKLDEAINIRNLVGCHFNEWAGELSDQEVIGMAELALELSNALICENCGSLPISDKSGSYWECSCKKSQMHPLKTPVK